MLGEIDYSLKPKRLQLFIAKPDQVPIGKLNKYIYGLEFIPRLGRLSELSFTVPYEINDVLEGLTIPNPMIDKILDRYVIKAVDGGKEEWFIINQVSDNMDTGDTKSVHCLSLGYELRDKQIRGYKVDSYLLSQVANEALSSSLWAVGDIDSKFEGKYRSFDVSEQTVLDFIYEIADTFGALVEFDTANRLIHFRDLDNVGLNRGLTISYGKYLKRLGKTSESDEMVTRFYAYGKDNLSINRVNPSSSSYLEDFSYFTYPFDAIRKWADIKDKRWSDL